MEIVCKRHTELPHTSRLFSDLLYHYDRAGRFYDHNPFDPASYQAAAQAIDFPAERRASLVAALRAQNGDSPELDVLAQPGAVAVLTGQQVGLYSGPAYSIYKALTAVRLARQLTENGTPAVPVFWLATEDHDLAEVSSCWTFNASNEPVLLRVSDSTHAENPVGGIPIQDAPLEQLRASLAGFPYADEVYERVRDAYAGPVSFGEAFPRLVRSLLSGLKLLYFDPMHPASRALAAPLLRMAVKAAPELSRDILIRDRELNDAGYHAQVHFESHTSLFFLLHGGKRLSLRRRDNEYQSADRRYSSEELADRAASLSPNAILRPVVQDYMFPTVAYIGGPAELAYLAQSEVVYRALLGRMPVAAPRTGFTLIDGRARKLMERYGLTLESFYGGPEPLREEIAARLTPPEIVSIFEQVSEKNETNLKDLRAAIAGFDRTLAESLDRGAAKIRYQLTKMQRKVARESLRRSLRAQEESAYLYGLLYPHKHLQERFYTILPFLARHGTELIGELYNNVHLDCPDHHVVYL